MQVGDEYYAFGPGYERLGLFRHDMTTGDYIVFKFDKMGIVPMLQEPQCDHIPIVVIDLRIEERCVHCF